MNKKTLILFLYAVLYSFRLLAQTDDYTGTWTLKNITSSTPAKLELQIGSPEKNILYPAQLTVSCDSFKAVYEMLLVRKNLRQLGISRNKYPRSEEPFSIGDWTITLNGTFDFSRDLKGEPMLTVNRLPAKKYPVALPDLLTLNDTIRKTTTQIVSMLRDEEIVLKKINNIPWENKFTENILSPKLSPTYFGLLDTIHLKTKDGIINFFGNKKSDDIITINLNGKTIVDQVEAKKTKAPEDILLDTGLNILTLFADNFNKSLPNKAKAGVEFANRKFDLDFTNQPDIAATFITAKLYFDRDKDADTKFQSIDMSLPGNKILNRNEKLIGSIVSTSQQITLALWDDAVEDGDSVSININGKWLVKGFPVKKNPQFITVKLDQGPNMITFVADNLGSIPPNTSVLEIIDGKKRKSFSIETSLDQNNLVKIFYEYKPAQ